MKPKTKSELMAEWAMSTQICCLSMTSIAGKLKSGASSWQWKG